MKSSLFDMVRKWAIGVCLVLYCCIFMTAPAALLLGLAFLEVPSGVIKVLIGIYVVTGIPLIAYHSGQAFGLRYGRDQRDI